MRFVCRQLFAVALLGSACGGFQNEPLRETVVRGQVSRSDANAWASIIGQPESRFALGTDGNFEFRGLATGPGELFAIANGEEALRVPFEAKPGSVVDLGVLAPKPGGFIELEVDCPDGLSLAQGSASVGGIPYRVQTDDDGDADIGPLPQGCYEITFSVPGVGTLLLNACSQVGEHAPLVLHLPRVDGSPGHEGCAVTGCLQGLSCQHDGHCQ